MADTAAPGAHNGGANVAVVIDDKDVDVLFEFDVEALKAYWTAPHSLLRNEDAMGKSTLEAHVQWARRYRTLQLGSRAATLGALIADLPAFTRYLDGRSHLSMGTRAGEANSMLAILKYVFAGAYRDDDVPREIALVRNIRNELQRAYETELRSRYVCVQ